MRKYIYSCLLLFSLFACKEKAPISPQVSSKDISKVITQMTDVMIHDVTNPPLAARFFAYTCLAAYEVVALHEAEFPSMYGKLNDFPKIEKPSLSGEYNYELAAVLAMYETAKKLQPSGQRLDTLEKKWLDSLQVAGVAQAQLELTRAYAEAISAQILAYAKADGYNRISNYPRYTPLGTEGAWYPTPPGYFAPVEPYFSSIRSFTLDSAAQFKPVPPAAFSIAKKSSFYTQMQEVYAQDLTQEKLEIAAFWDCNPFALLDNGHLMVGMKKISPGAHWMGIAGIACQQRKLTVSKTIQVFTTLAIGLMDGFYCCWDEKYRSNRIRPETAIRKYIDPQWKPFLQTPPFPEYLSGHSTISTAAATILTHFLGDNFAFTDTVEERFGLKKRSFTSFSEAAAEAAISRLYGGIHFMDAIVNGQEQGEKVGALVVGKVL
ncbi:vanadium-dependent haloperoxidase [Haliscomenobacter sp.]|uniref:vanadium-dependent haloperoxidase n=1 Tax=Haliscomenobacter sp. TaxID=2717303 RepID=UPI00359304EE